MEIEVEWRNVKGTHHGQGDNVIEIWLIIVLAVEIEEELRNAAGTFDEQRDNVVRFAW